MSTQQQIIEHVVLFNVKPDVEPTKVAAMIAGLKGLVSLDLAIHVSAGELSKSRSCNSLTFSHILHCRFKSNTDLQPIIDDIMVVDWISDNNIINDSLKPGSVMRVTLLKLKADLVGNEKTKFFEMTEGLKNRFKAIEDVSYGENLPNDYSKGYSISSIGVFPRVAELEAFDLDVEMVKSLKEEVKGLVESEIVVDYVIPVAN
ncbi:hypothetical protein LXL04_002337 [Taraxacum kok-saghyz]